MMLLPNPWLILAAVVAVGGAWGLGHHQGEKSGANEVQVRWDAEINKRALQTLENKQRVSDTELKLQKESNETREATAKKLEGMATTLAAATDELRKQRVARGSAVGAGAASGSGASGGATGAGLYSDDAVFLTRKSDLFERIRLQRDECYAAYGRAQKALASLSTQAAGTLPSPSAAQSAPSSSLQKAP